MRKGILFTLIIFISFTLIGRSEAATSGIKLNDYSNQSELKRALKLSSPFLLGNIFILPFEKFNELEAAKIITRIDKLPTSILSKMDKQNIKLKLFNGKLTDNPTVNHLAGIIPRGYKNSVTWDDVPGIGGAKTVLVKIGSSDKGNGHSSENLELHELAHTLDKLIFHGVSKKQYFQFIWKMEKDRLFPNQEYFLTYSEEYFAESFTLFYFNNETRQQLKINAPLTYELIKELK